MAEAANPREKRAAVAAIFLAAWPVCWLALYLLLTAGIVDASKIQAWLGEKPPLRFVRESYRQALLSSIWIPFAAALTAFPVALKLAPRAVKRYGHLAFLGLPAGYSDEPSARRWPFRRRRPLEQPVSYRFSSRALPLLGRRHDLQLLNGFLGKREKLLWWWNVGGPGSGKSRLALEWVLSLQGRTGGLLARADAGFLRRSTGEHSWTHWEPRRPTVIVIDDASGRAEEVAPILRTLAEHQSSFRFPVRVLLVDRTVPESLRALNGDPVCGADRYNEPLEVKGIPDCLDELAEAVAAKRGCRLSLKPDGRALILKLTGGSPLFMAWALDSIATTGELKWTSWQDLLRTQIDRLENELKEWKLSEGPGGCAPLLALATLTRGLSWTAAKRFRPDITDEDRRRLIRLQYADNESVFPVQPDLLGEFFLLEQFAFVAPDDRESFRAQARDAHSVRTDRTLYSLHCDFGDHPQLALLDQMPGEAGAAEAWGMRRVYLLAEERDEERKTRYRRDLLDLAARNGAQFALPLACDAFNRLNARAREGDWPGVAASWHELHEIAAPYPDDHNMQRRLAGGAVNLVSRYGAARKWEDAAGALDLLKEIGRRFPESPDIQLQVAMGTRDVVLTFDPAEMWDRTLAAWEELQDTARSFPADAKIQTELALGAGDLAAYCEDASRRTLLDQAWQILKTVAAAYPGDAAVQNAFAIGVQNRMRNVNDLEEIRRSWPLLLDVSARFSDDRTVQRVVAAASANAIVLFGRFADLEGVAQASRQLQVLSKQFPDDRELHAAVARGTIYEMRRHDEAGNAADFEQAWERLRWVAAAFPNALDINVLLARGAYDAYVHYLHARDSAKMDNAWNWLEAENARFPGHPEIWPLLRDAPLSPYKM